MTDAEILERAMAGEDRAGGSSFRVLTDEVRRLRTQQLDLVDSFIKESPRPDCDSDMRFRAVMQDGMCRWFPSRIAATLAILKAAGLGGDS